MSVAVQTPVFDGPFDLLLHLILRDEVDLYEVSLSQIVDEYIATLEKMEAFELEVATEFLMIAATLVELKSRRLLPDPPGMDLDDEFGLWEERDLLLARLLECKTFKDAAQTLLILSEDASLSYPRTAGIEEPFIGLLPDLMINVTPEDVRAAFIKATAPKPIIRVETSHLAPISLNVSDAVSELVLDLPERGKVNFATVTAQLVDRIEVVVYFLAVLELYKQNLVEIEQFTNFGEIQLEWVGNESDLENLPGITDDYDG